MYASADFAFGILDAAARKIKAHQNDGGPSGDWGTGSTSTTRRRSTPWRWRTSLYTRPSHPVVPLMHRAGPHRRHAVGPSTAFFDDEVLSGLDALAGLEGCSEIFTLAEDLGLHHACDV